MFEDPDINRFVYIVIGAAVISAIVWFFLIAPMERKRHEQKLANLQQKIKKHEESLAQNSNANEPIADSNEHSN